MDDKGVLAADNNDKMKKSLGFFCRVLLLVRFGVVGV
jgi:hypothetical protein